MTKRTALEGMAALLRLGVIRIIAIVVSRTQLRVGQDFVRLVDGGHLFLRLVLGHTLGVRLVRVVLLHQLTVRSLDRPFVRVPTDPEDLVVIFLLRPLQECLCLLKEGLNLLGVLVMLASSF